MYTLIINIILLIFIQAAHAATHTVGKTGTYPTVKQAIAAALPGDELVLEAQEFKEGTIVVDKRVTIRGLPGAVLDGEKKHEVLLLKAEGIVIRELAIRNAGISHLHENAAIRAEGAHRCVVENTALENNFFAIYLAKSDGCIIRGNTIRAGGASESSAGNGIHLWSSSDATIADNLVEGHRDGIYFEFVKNSSIARNVSRGNLRYGLHFMFSDGCRYQGNRFEKNGAGVAVMYTKRIEMKGNTFSGNWGPAAFGILLKEITDSTIHDNIFVRNSSGLMFEGALRIDVRGNRFESNGWAVRMMGDSFDNTFERNAFVANSFDVTSNASTSKNTFTKNYWDNYKGYDLNRDGLGDVPYRPVTLYALLVERDPSLLILMRSMIVDILNIAETVFPLLTPELLVDREPLIKSPL